MSDSEVDKVLDVMIGSSEVTLSSGRTIHVKKATLRTLKPIMVLLRSVMDQLHVRDGVVTVDLSDPAVILSLLEGNVDGVYDVICLLSDVTLDELLDMPGDDSLAIIMAIIDINKLFFSTTIKPLLAKMPQT